MAVPTDRRPIGFWLKLVDRLIDARLEASLGGLSRRHWQVLNVAGRAAPVRPRSMLESGHSSGPKGLRPGKWRTCKSAVG